MRDDVRPEVLEYLAAPIKSEPILNAAGDVVGTAAGVFSYRGTLNETEKRLIKQRLERIAQLPTAPTDQK